MQPASAGPLTLAYSSPSGLVSSTGNLYWTSAAIDEFGPDSATVYRASKSNTPGRESVLYRESGDRSGYYYFGNIVWALTDTYYGYFVANYNDGGVATSQIKRVPLAAGSAVVLANSPQPIGTRDLATDGTRLFWADADAIRSIPIGGGALTTLASGGGIARLGVDANYVYFGQRNALKRVSKTGGVVTTLVSAPSNINALYVSTSNATVYWGEVGGAVRSVPAAGGGVTNHQTPIAGRDVTSVGFDGARVLWTDCAEPGNTSCAVRKRQGGTTTTISSGSVGAGHLQFDAASLYWGDVTGLHKYVY
jgi:hypothetical protein